MSTRKAMATILSLFALAALTAGVACADSMLTTSPAENEDGLIFIGEDTVQDPCQEKFDQDVLFVTLKRKVDRIWGPETVSRKMEEDGERIDFYIPEHVPDIYVTYKVKTSSPVKVASAYKYKHNYTSRHRSKDSSTKLEYKKINITPIIFREAKKNNISPLLLKAVIQTESNFDPHTVSPAGAMGLCQLMPRTARYLGCKDPFDPEENIKAGAKYLAMMKKMFKSLDLTLAAYNAGPGTVSRSGGVPNIYETRRYIKKVRRNMKW